MRGTKRIIICLFTILLGLMAVTACATANQSPESVARTLISASAKMDFDKMIECSDYTGEYKDSEVKKAAKAMFDLGISVMPADAKAQVKTYKFKRYEKIDSKDVEEIEEIGEDKTVAITKTETGKVTITYKKDGKGETLEETLEMVFIKVDGKWYTKTESLITI